MKTNTAKKVGAVIGTVALVGSGVAIAAPVLASESTPSAAASQVVQVKAAEDSAAAENVQGSFNFDQSAVSSNASISEVFAKASAALCSALPNYGVMNLAHAIVISGNVDSAFEATVSEMASDTEEGAMVMACACASNVPGGGAIVNAEVSGVTLESIANKAGA